MKIGVQGGQQPAQSPDMDPIPDPRQTANAKPVKGLNVTVGCVD